MSLLEEVSGEHLIHMALKDSVNYFFDVAGLRVVGEAAEFRVKGEQGGRLAARFLSALDGSVSLENLTESVPPKLRPHFLSLLEKLKENQMLTTGWSRAFNDHDLSGVILYLRERTPHWVDCLRQINEAPVAVWAGIHTTAISSLLQKHGFSNLWQQNGTSLSRDEPFFSRRPTDEPEALLRALSILAARPEKDLVLIHAEDEGFQLPPENDLQFISWPSSCVSGLVSGSARLVAGMNPTELMLFAQETAPRAGAQRLTTLSRSVYFASICYHAIEKRLAPFLEGQLGPLAAQLVSIIRSDGTSSTKAYSDVGSMLATPANDAVRSRPASGRKASVGPPYPERWFDPDFGRFRWTSSEDAALPLALSRLCVLDPSRENDLIVVEQWGLDQSDADTSAVLNAVAELEYACHSRPLATVCSPPILASNEAALSDQLSVWIGVRGVEFNRTTDAFRNLDDKALQSASLASLLRICYLYTDTLPDLSICDLEGGGALVRARVGTATGYWVDLDSISGIRIAVGDAIFELQTGKTALRQKRLLAMFPRLGKHACSDPGRPAATRASLLTHIQKSQISTSHAVGWVSSTI